MSFDTQMLAKLLPSLVLICFAKTLLFILHFGFRLKAFEEEMVRVEQQWIKAIVSLASFVNNEKVRLCGALFTH